MRRLVTVFIVSVLSVNSALPLIASATTVVESAPPAPNILIVEVAPGTLDGKKGKEFVELYNADNTAVNLKDWQIKKRAASATSEPVLYAKIPVDFMLKPGARVTFATTEVGLSDPRVFPVTATGSKLMSDAGGAMLLVRPTDTREEIVDQMEWGSAIQLPAEAMKVCTVESAASDHPGEFSYKRVQDTLEEKFIDTDGVETDFCIGAHMTPSNDDGVVVTDLPLAQVEPEPTPELEPEPEPEIIPTPDPEETPAEPPVEGGMGGGMPAPLPIYLSELLVDPTTPQTDDKDEYIELYNPNDEPVNLKDYQLEAGSTWQTHYNILDVTIPAHGYVTFTSATTPINLTNTGGQVRLLDPQNKVLDETHYNEAKAGEAWMKDEAGTWAWTTKPTPALLNELVVPVVPLAALATAKPKAAPKAKLATAKKATTPKVAGAKTTKPKKKEETTPAPAIAATTHNPLPNYLALGAVGSLVIGYGAYEYRQEIGNFFGRMRKAKAEQSGGEGEV